MSYQCRYSTRGLTLLLDVSSKEACDGARNGPLFSAGRRVNDRVEIDEQRLERARAFVVDSSVAERLAFFHEQVGLFVHIVRQLGRNNSVLESVFGRASGTLHRVSFHCVAARKQLTCLICLAS